MERTIVSKVEDWTPVAEQIVNIASEQGHKTMVVALSGDLGVGKTTLVQQLAKTMGVTETVTSPTFTIMKRYETTNDYFSTLIHMDAYRLESEDELEPLRFDELLTLPNTLFCIEWAEKIKNSLPPETIWLSLEIDKDGRHTIQTVSK